MNDAVVSRGQDRQLDDKDDSIHQSSQVSGFMKPAGAMGETLESFPSKDDYLY